MKKIFLVFSLILVLFLFGCEKKKVVITIDGESYEAVLGKEFTLPNLEKEGFVLTGFKDDLGTIYRGKIKVKEALNLVSVFEKQILKVIFITENITNKLDFPNYEVEYNDIIFRPKKLPLRDEFVFLHWSESQNGEPFTFEKALKKSVTLYPCFREKMYYTVTFISEGVKNKDLFVNATVEENTVFSKPTVKPIKDGFRFIHFSLKENGPEFDFNTKINQNIEIHFVFEDNAPDPAFLTNTYDASASVTNKDGKLVTADITGSELLYSHRSLVQVRKIIGKTKVGANYDKMDHVFFALDIAKNKNIELIPYAFFEKGKYTLATVRKLAEDYEFKHPDKKVLAGVNYSFYDINRKQPTPGQMSGWYVNEGRVYKPVSSFNALTYNNGDKNSLISISNENIRIKKYVIRVYESFNKLFDNPLYEEEAKINNKNGNVFFGWRSGSDWQYPEVTDAHLIREVKKYGPYGKTNTYVEGRISNKISRKLRFGEVAIKLKNDYENKVVVVEAIMEIKKDGKWETSPYKYMCDYQHQILLNQNCVGEWEDRHPRTFIGQKADGSVIFFVCHGRESVVKGMRSSDMAAFAKAFGIVNAYNFDGGGSSTMIIRKPYSDVPSFIVVNNPSDGHERYVSNCLLVVTNK